MSKASQQQYKDLKQQYDQLLDKNQSDLIKIKQKQKMLKQQLDSLNKQKQEQKHQLSKKIQALEQQIKKKKKTEQIGSLNVTVEKKNNKVEELEIDVRRLMDQNISLTAQNTNLKLQYSQQVNKNQVLAMQVKDLKAQIDYLKLQLSKKLKQEKQLVNSAMNTTQNYVSKSLLDKLEQQTKKLDHKFVQLKQKNRKLNQQFKIISEQSKILADSERKSMRILKKKQHQLSQLESQIHKLKLHTKIKRKTQHQDDSCSQCKNLQQEIVLLKQMVKSTQGMVRVRQIQNNKIRIHNGQDSILMNKSLSKHNSQKSTPFPPIKKK